MAAEHAAPVLAIFQEGMDTGNATFDAVAPSWSSWDAAWRDDLRLVAVDGDAVVGWAAGRLINTRPVHAGVAEVGLYVADAARGRGVGRSLLSALVVASERVGVWTLQSHIFPENGASLATHERCGFRVVGRRERLGRHGGRWRDVLLLERRAA